MAAVEKFEKKMAVQAMAMGPNNGSVVVRRMSMFFLGLRLHPPGVSAGRIGILAI